jgi:uroporphyrinogen decarboxylase
LEVSGIAMTHRDRVLAALRHQTPDRTPLDLGSSLASTINVTAYQRLREHLGLETARQPAIWALRSSTVIPDEDILQHFDIDLRPVILGAPDAGGDRPVSEHAFLDEWGVTWTKPADGHYLATDGPFLRLEEPALADLEKHPWPDPSDPGRFRGLRERARELRETSDCAVVLNLGVGPLHLCQFMRGWAEWLEDLLVNPAFGEGLFERTVDFFVQVAERALAETAEFVDIAWFGDDVGSQRSLLMRPDLYRRVVKPRHRRIVDAIKRRGKLAAYHSCGSVYAILPDLVDIGVDILNPVQVAAAHMDTARLKREFGRDLAFWGAIDTQRVLSRGTPEEVREQVRRRLADLAAAGGYILCAVHNIQAEVPPENIVAMYQAARDYGG